MSIANPNIFASSDSNSRVDTKRIQDLFIFLRILENYVNLFMNAAAIKNSRKIYFACILDTLQGRWSIKIPLSYVTYRSFRIERFWFIFNLCETVVHWSGRSFIASFIAIKETSEIKYPHFYTRRKKTRRLVRSKGSL